MAITSGANTALIVICLTVLKCSKGNGVELPGLRRALSVRVIRAAGFYRVFERCFGAVTEARNGVDEPEASGHAADAGDSVASRRCTRSRA